MNQLRRGAVLALALCFAAAGCNRSADSGGDDSSLNIAYASAGETLPFVATVTRSIESAANEDGADLAVVDNGLDAAKSVTVARDVITKKPDVFLEYNGFEDSNTQIAKLLDEQDIPLVAVQYPIGDAPLFAIDNDLVGRTGGAALAAAAAKKWGADAPVEALMMNLPSGGQIQLDRGDGAKSAISETLSNVTFTDGDTKNDINVARQVTADFLTAHPDDHVIIWTHVDSMAAGELAAIESAGREGDVLLMGTGGDEALFGDIRNNPSLVGTVALFPEKWGPILVDLATKVAAGEDVPDVTNPPAPAVLTRDNLSKYYP
jgi:ribose transport system substrate-binding protein